MARKKKSKKKKNCKVLTPKVIISILAFIVLVCFLILIFLNDSSEDRNILIENKHVNLEEWRLYFTITNPYDLPADCQINAEKERLSQNVGIIPPHGSKDMKFDRTYDLNFTVDCVWKDMDGCEGSTFKACEIIKKHPEALECLNQEIYYQGFCLASYLNNATYCDLIRLKHKRIHCFAYHLHNESICDELDEQKDWCYEDLARNWRKPELCEKIEDDLHMLRCIAIVSRDISKCPIVDGEKDKYCVEVLSTPEHR